MGSSFRIVFGSLVAAFVVPLAAQDLVVRLELERQPPPVALVWAEGLTDWAAERVVIDQRNRAFLPELAVCPPGGTVVIANHDDQQHNVFALDRRLGVDVDLGLGQPETLLDFPVTWPANEVVRAGCKIHPQMRLWVAALTTRHHAVLLWPVPARQAELRLIGVPADVRSLRCWTPKTEPVSLTIVGSGAEQRLTWKGEAVGRATVEPLPSP